MNRQAWERARRRVFERDGWRCVSCGIARRVLECDHTTPLQREPGQDPLDENGLQTLCRGCHIEKTRKENGSAQTPAGEAWEKLLSEFI